MTRIFKILILLALVMSTSANAINVTACKELHWRPFQIYTVKSALHRRTHVILPEPIQGSPVTGSPQLWDVDAENIHLFIKPKNLGNKEGKETTVTAISTSNTSYDFNIIRVNKDPDTCIRIINDNTFVQGRKQGWETSEQRANTNLVTENNELKQMVVSMEQGKKILVSDALMAYRKNVFTGYVWTNARGHLKESIVLDVWDDGRFTFVRLQNPKEGLLTVTALIDGDEEMADYNYDPITKLYMISGLYPQFVLKYDDSVIEVTRSKQRG